MSESMNRRMDGDEGVRVRRSEVRDAIAMERARDRFGGLDIPASLAGALAALALALIIGGILGAAIGGFGYQWGVEVDGIERELSVGGMVAGVVVLFVAFLVGGWVAGRMARFDGGKNGLVTAIWVLLLAAVLGALGAWLGREYDVFAEVDLPQWFSGDAMTGAAIASGVASAAAMLVGGYLGGTLGERYHRRADAALLSVRDGGLGARRVVRRVEDEEPTADGPAYEGPADEREVQR